MASNDQEILKSVLSQRRAQVAPDSTSQDYFELFCAEQILKNFDLTYEDLQTGVVDGEHDGGVDSVYGFVNGELVHEDLDCASFKKDVKLEFHIIQSKTSEGFRESAINSLISTTRHLLKLDADYDALTQYNSSVKTVFNNFRSVYRALASTFPSLKIHYYYASRKADTHIHDNLLRKADELKEIATDMFSGVDVHFDFIGARSLLELARRRPRTTPELRVIKNLSDVNGYIVLSRLDEYARFLTWIIREDGDSEGDTGASVWYKRCAHKRLATTETPA